MYEIPLGGGTTDKQGAQVTRREPGTVASDYADGNIDPKPGINPAAYWSTVGQLTSQTPITTPSDYLTATFRGPHLNKLAVSRVCTRTSQ